MSSNAPERAAPADSGLRLWRGVPAEVAGPLVRIDGRTVNYPDSRASIRLRQVGWLDQAGRVWLDLPPQAEFDGGSLTPLLIPAGD